MKVINYIHIKDMFVHKDTRIEFQEGKNFIVGQIGSGKTLINECIAFSFFGSVALRGKATSYKKSEVELSFNYNNESFIIKRKINDASLLMHDKESNQYLEICNSTSIVNQKIISLLGYNYDIYLLSNYCKQKKLAYFSELTPAKRLQYIDKVSGIEESKEFGSYLIAKRKTLKENISLLKDMVKQPELNKEIDLSFDYDQAIKELNIKLGSISDLYAKYDALLTKSTLSIPEPSLSLSLAELELLKHPVEILTEVEHWFHELIQRESHLNKLEIDLKQIPILEKQYQHLSLEEVEHMISMHSRALAKSIAEDLHFNCNHCNKELDFKRILDQTSVNNYQSIHIPLKDLYNIKDYLINNYSVVRKNLEKVFSKLEKAYDDFIEQPPVVDLIKYKDYTTFESTFNSAHRSHLEYTERMALYSVLKEACASAAQEASACRDEIEEFLKGQSELVELKDSYIKLSTEKDIYIQRLDIYNTSKVKYNSFVTQLDIVSELLKKLDAITLKIKNETIPLINHFASYYLNLITSGAMATIEITDDYNLIVDGTEIALKSGGETDLASLAFRLSLSKSIITGQLPLFIGDEIDSSGSKEVSDDIMQALDTINDEFQIILVTHKNTEDLTDCNIIQL